MSNFDRTGTYDTFILSVLRNCKWLACEQAHLFGVSREYLGGVAAKASRRSRREEWGEEK